MPIGNGGAPSLSVERVAILYDEQRRVEHFIREVRFDGASAAFAFVVPTPDLPEIAKVSSSVFKVLEREFPLDPPPESPGVLSRVTGAKSLGVEAAGVTVLSTQQVGKFTAFVLAASDATGLSQWLTENRIALPWGGQEWLDHYVGLKFYFAAFRYESPGGQRGPIPEASPPEDASGRFATPKEPPPDPPSSPEDSSMTSETVRLSFSSAVPFFPYLEPARTAKGDDRPHTMEAWVVSRHAREPRLRRMVKGSEPRWGWAWEARLAYERDASDVTQPLPEFGRLLPSDGRYHVQTFRDSRRNRDGWGDILFPVAKSKLDEPSWRALALSLLGDLDQGLHAGEAEPHELSQEEAFKMPPIVRGCACSVGEEGERGAIWGALAGVALLAVRRGRRAGDRASLKHS